MTVFKAFLKVLNKCKTPIIMYTVFLVFFGGFNLQTSDNSMQFEASKPDVFVINHDEDRGLTKHLIKYIEENSNVIELKNDEDALKDALFYRDVNYIIEIPQNFREDFLNHKSPEIEVKSTGDYQSTLAEMMLEKYLKVASIYQNSTDTEEEMLKSIEHTLSKEVKTEITTKLDTSALDKATFFYNFTNYCILAGCIYVICLILSSFKDEKISKRTIVSSMDYKEYNRKLLLSNGLFAIVLWAFYVILSFILVGNVMFTFHGAIYVLNSFIFTLCSLTIAFLIGNIVRNKNAINGIVNVIALGSSFLCGAFVPVDFLPSFVLKIAHIFPSYWFIRTNEMLKGIEVINLKSLTPLFVNMAVVLGFSILFVLITNIISKRTRKK